MERLIEQIACASQHRYGRHTEKLSVIEGQLNLFNEMEKVMETIYVLEPELEEVCKPEQSKKRKGKREEELKAAGCWNHTRRKYAEALKGIKKKEDGEISL